MRGINLYKLRVIFVKQIHKHLCLLFQRLVTLGFEIGDCTLWIIISIAVKRRLGQIIQKPLMCLFIQLCIIFTINSVSAFSPVQYKNSDRFTCTPGGFPALYSHILFHTAINLTFAFYFSGNPSVRSLRLLTLGRAFVANLRFAYFAPAVDRSAGAPILAAKTQHSSA